MLNLKPTIVHFIITCSSKMMCLQCHLWWRGYHKYIDVWSARINRVELPFKRELGNPRDTSAIAVIEWSWSGELTLGHVPQLFVQHLFVTVNIFSIIIVNLHFYVINLALAHCSGFTTVLHYNILPKHEELNLIGVGYFCISAVVTRNVQYSTSSVLKCLDHHMLSGYGEPISAWCHKTWSCRSVAHTIHNTSTKTHSLVLYCKAIVIHPFSLCLICKFSAVKIRVCEVIQIYTKNFPIYYM